MPSTATWVPRPTDPHPAGTLFTIERNQISDVVNTWFPRIKAQNAVAEDQCALVVECVDVHYLLSGREFIAYLHFFPSYVSCAQLQVFKTHIDAFTCADTLYDCFASLANCINNFYFNSDDGSKAGPILHDRRG